MRTLNSLFVCCLALCVSFLSFSNARVESGHHHHGEGDSHDKENVKYTHLVTFSCIMEGEKLDDIVLGLRGDVVPKTVENFVKFCEGVTIKGKHYSYLGCPFHRIIEGFMIQGGDITMRDGTGSISIYGQRFPDENFELKHHAGVISMANRGPNTNGSQFFITTIETPWLNGHHVVFGDVIEGREVVQKIETTGNDVGNPTHITTIKTCTVKRL